MPIINKISADRIVSQHQYQGENDKENGEEPVLWHNFLTVSDIQAQSAFFLIDTDIIEYKGCLIFVDDSVAREHLEEDEFLIDELVGLNVYDGDERVGAVVGVSNNGASDLLSVKTNSKNICLVPFVKAIVLSVDIKKKRIQINNIEGLLSWDLMY